MAKDMGRRDKIAEPGAGKASGVRMQYGALCWRVAPESHDCGIEVLLITSRDTGRWIIPKGWPIPGLSPEAAAAQEAWEEAGVAGETDPACLGRFGYQKVFTLQAQVLCAVAVYSLQVRHLADTFPEAAERTRRWFPQGEAATLVLEPDLGRLIAAFVPPESGRQAPIIGE